MADVGSGGVVLLPGEAKPIELLGATIRALHEGAKGSRKLNLYTPAAMVGYFEELAGAIEAGDGEEGGEPV